MRWKDRLLSDITAQSEVLPVEMLEKITNERINLHLAIFSEPFLGLLLDGTKTMESRFSINNVAPFRKIISGDLVFVKRTGGGVCAIFEVGEVHYFSNLKPSVVEDINSRFGTALCWDHDPEFLGLKSTARFLTVLSAKKLYQMKELQISKSDRTGWVVVRRGLINTLFDDEKNK